MALTRIEISKRWREAHPGAATASALRWRAKNKDKYMLNYRAWCRRKSADVKLQVVAMLGGCCVWCGFSDIRALQLDHINDTHEGFGHPLRSGDKLYRAIIAGVKSREDFQLLCANCNTIKEVERRRRNRK